MPDNPTHRKGGLAAALGGPRRARALRAALLALAGKGGPDDKAVDPTQAAGVPSPDTQKRSGASPRRGGAALDSSSGGAKSNRNRDHATVRAADERVNSESAGGRSVSVDPDGTFRPDPPRLGPTPTSEERAVAAKWYYEAAFKRGDHAELAQRLHAAMEIETGGDLFYDEGSFFQYHIADGVYRPVDEHDIDIKLMRMAGAPIVRSEGRGQAKIITVNGNDARGVLRYIRSLVAHKAKASQRPARFADAAFGLNCTNGFLRVNPDGTVALLPKAPAHLARHAVAFAYDENAPHPMLDAFFRNVFEDAVEDGDLERRVALLQEFLGACFFGIACHYQKLLVLYGMSGGNGKSQFLQICRSIFPPDSVSSVAITSWNNRFTPISMLGKMANFVDEIPVGIKINDTSVFKIIIDGQPAWLEEKGKQGFNATIKCGHIVNMNKMPSTTDVTPSFFRRFLVCPFECDLRNSEVREENIGQKIGRLEAPGILAWAIQGAMRLQRQGHFTSSARGNYIARSWRSRLDPLMSFLANIDAGTKIGARELYASVKDATKTTMSETAFGRWLTNELCADSDPSRLFDKIRGSGQGFYVRRENPYLNRPSTEPESTTSEETRH